MFGREFPIDLTLHLQALAFEKTNVVVLVLGPKDGTQAWAIKDRVKEALKNRSTRVDVIIPATGATDGS